MFDHFIARHYTQSYAVHSTLIPSKIACFEFAKLVQRTIHSPAPKSGAAREHCKEPPQTEQQQLNAACFKVKWIVKVL